EKSFLTISATDIVVLVCSKTPLLYLLTQKVAQKIGYVLGIGDRRLFAKLECFIKLLPLQGAGRNAMIPRAMPWATSFCPFRAWGAILAPSALSGRVGQ
ncbi:hypothetical protein, partial [Segatella copri]|uniref:hypothetical protein n=1 Tax=Segatella copri TaxID=165179 RepID=UPI001EE3DE36